MGKEFYQRESRSLDLPSAGQVLERAENLKILGSSNLQSGGPPETRTRTPLRAADFESATSTIPSGGHECLILKENSGDRQWFLWSRGYSLTSFRTF